MSPPIERTFIEDQSNETQPACVLAFNANDPSGASGTAADVSTMASVGAHALPVLTGTYIRDTAQIFDHIAMDDEAVAEQARTILEDIAVQLIKVGFVGTPENLAVTATICADYPDTAVVAYMPNLSWWDEVQIDLYQEAFKDMILPQTSVLIGSYSTLWRWLLPDWQGERSPNAREIAQAADALGVPYTLVTGVPLPDQFIDNVLASAQTVIASEKFERFEAVFAGAGETLSAAFAALLASGCDVNESFNEALIYLDHCLESGFRPGMGHVVPDRLFWAQPDADDEAGAEPADPSISLLELPSHDTKH